MLDVRDITVAFGGAAGARRRRRSTVGDGEVVALLGPSGSGKSTLLRVIAGLVAPGSRARSCLDGVDVTDVPTHRRGIGMVFQDEQLFPHRDVAANVAFGLRMQGVGAATRDAPGRRAAGPRRPRRLRATGAVTELSGGEAKRVALARSLAPAPRALLLDEPLTGLDRELHDRLAVELGPHPARRRHDRRCSSPTTPPRPRPSPTGSVTMATLGRAGISVVELAAGDTLRPAPAGAAHRHAVDRRRRSTATTSRARPHLGVADDRGAVVAISSWTAEPLPGSPRPTTTSSCAGMAVDPTAARRASAPSCSRPGVERAFAAGAETVWANARDTALGFYGRHGFDVVGDGFLDPTTALPHHRIRRPRVA